MTGTSCGAAWGGVSSAAAPAARASLMNRDPSVFTPGRAAKRYPGRTSRESAVRPAISGSPGVGRAISPEMPVMRSVSRKFLSPRRRQFNHQRTADFGRIFVDRGNSHNRRHARHGAAHRRGCYPTPGRKACGLNIAMRFIDADHHEIARIIDREDADEGGEEIAPCIMLALDLLGGTGLAADQITGGGGEFSGAVFDDEPQ